VTGFGPWRLSNSFAASTITTIIHALLGSVQDHTGKLIMWCAPHHQSPFAAATAATSVTIVRRSLPLPLPLLPPDPIVTVERASVPDDHRCLFPRFQSPPRQHDGHFHDRLGLDTASQRQSQQHERKYRLKEVIVVQLYYFRATATTCSMITFRAIPQPAPTGSFRGWQAWPNVGPLEICTSSSIILTGAIIS
jgi:hypothetical protein